MSIGVVLKNLGAWDRFLFLISAPIILLSAFTIYMPYFLRVRRCVKNWPDVFLVTRGLKDHAHIEFADGSSMELSKSEHWKLASHCELIDMPEELKKGLKIRIVSDKVHMKFGKREIVSGLEFAPPIAVELYDKPHKILDVDGRDVVDIGAYVGDTAIYYALGGGAKKVYGLEIDPRIYREATALVKSNNLENKIYIFGIGIAADGNIDKKKLDVGALRKMTAQMGTSIKTISLDRLVDILNVRDGALKIDIEGFEYQIFDKVSSETLKRFRAIHIEYHYGYRTLVDRLKSEGFTIKMCTKPKYRFNMFSSAGITCQGEIIAELKTAK